MKTYIHDIHTSTDLQFGGMELAGSVFTRPLGDGRVEAVNLSTVQAER